MPKITSIGTPSAANTIIGGVPTIYYYDFTSKGRGEVLRLFFEEAGIAFVDHRWSFDEHNSGMTEEERALVNPSGSVPYLDINGRIYVQSYAILRHFSALLNKYDGKDLEERYRVDLMNDLAVDWRTLFVTSAFKNDKTGLYVNDDASPFKFHKSFNLPKYVKAIEKHLASSPYASKGPFILGDELSYADLVIFQIVHDEREVGDEITPLLNTIAPHLKKLVEGVSARPNIAAYFASDRYYN